MNSVVPFRLVSETSLKQAAINYARLGFRIFPLKDREKTPRIKSWPNQATTDADKIAKWWSMWPDANIGLATGTKSEVFVVDVDSKNNGDVSLATLFDEYGRFPITARQRTGNGEHYLFKCHSPITNRTNAPMKGIDIRGDGGYIVASPSIHPNGNRYSWEVEPKNIADAPSWLIELLNKSKNERVNTKGEIPIGSRNDSLFKIGCSLRSKGIKALEIGAELFRINEYQCELPLTDIEVNKIIGNVNQYLNSEKLPLFQYRDYIRSDLPKDPHLRHILHCISFYMDVDGKPAYPTQEKIAMDTGLTRATVIAKLKIAEQNGYILRKKNKLRDSGRFNYIYMLPKKFICKNQGVKSV